jgi:predicted nucleic acid-binding protein
VAREPTTGCARTGPSSDWVGDLGAQLFRDLPLGYADAAVIACVERRGGNVLTLDRRHFGVVEREGTIRVLP